MGTEWWKGWKGEKEKLIPDQQGCLELERKYGGATAVPLTGEVPEVMVRRPEPCLGCRFKLPCRSDPEKPNPCQPTWETAIESLIPNEVRLGCAKTKGKIRVVTMQSARVKRLLRPVHEAAYDFISRRKWCVRGTVTRDHLEPIIEDRREGEFFISGDYEAATDNLNPDAVEAVVEVLAEGLPRELGDLLLSSYRDIHWWSRSRRRMEIRRGSMMGNLLSFVVLCLLNKFCIAETFRSLHMKRRTYRINGDDIAFCGTEEVYKEWIARTSLVGFVVNHEKTGKSMDLLELNSSIFHVGKNCFIKKRNFGFLQFNYTPDEDGCGVFELCNQLRYKTAVKLLTCPQVRLILANRPLAVSSVPRRWWHFLVRRSWFRQIIVGEEPEEPERRQVPLKAGPILKELPGSLGEVAERMIRKAEREYEVQLAASWRGVASNCEVRKLVPSVPKRKWEKKKWILKKGPRKWERLWYPTVLEAIESRYPELLDYSNDGPWAQDQPGLRTRQSYLFYHPTKLDFQPPFSGIAMIFEDGSRRFVECE